MTDLILEPGSQGGGCETTDPGAGVRRDAVEVFRRRLLIVLLAGAMLWLVFGLFIMPAMLSRAYHGDGFLFLQRVLDHRDQHPLSHYLGKWDRLFYAALAAWIGGCALLLATTSRTFARRLVGVATPGTLGAIRVLICLLMLQAAFSEDIHSVVHLPITQRKSMGIMNWVYAAPIGFSQMVTSDSALTAYRIATLTAIALALLGFRTRLVLALSVILYLPLMGIARSYFWFNHSGIIPSYVAVVLCFTRCGDGWSLDRLIRIWRGRDVPPADEATAYYGWARYAVWTAIAVPYLAAGCSKLRFGGPWWWTGVNLQNILYTDALRPGDGHQAFILQFPWIPTWFYTILGAGTVIIEAGMILVLLSRWARLIWPVLAVAMHVGIQVLQKILFLDLIIIQAVFYDWSALRRWIGARWTRWRGGKLDVLFDGRCGLCRRTVRLLSGLDLFERLNFVDLHALDLHRYNDERHLSLDRAALNEAMHVVWHGQAFRGFDGFRKIAGSLPLLWVLAPLLYVPGVPAFGRSIYSRVARNRMSMHACAGGACAIAPAEPSPAARERASRPISLPRRLLGPVAIAFMIALLFGNWCLRNEYYPLTSMQMFATYTGTGVVTYYRAEQTDERGRVGQAFLDRMGFGASRYRPVMQNGFSDERGRKNCIDMLVRCGHFWNTRAPEGQRVTHLEVQKRQWDFVRDRDNPDYGRVVDRIVVDFDPATGAAFPR